MRRIQLLTWAAVPFVVLAAVAVILIRPASGAVVIGPEIKDRPREMRQPRYYPGFELSVLVEGRRVPEYHVRDKTYVEALRGAEYELQIRNPLPVRVAVALSVDGLNSIDARHTSAWNSSKWVIEPYGTITIGGWQMSSERARRFYFTTESDSYAAKLGQRANLGVISAVFFRERERYPGPITPPPLSRKPVDRGQPREETSGEAQRSDSAPKARVLTPSNDDYAATGIGRSVRNEVRWIQMDLDSRPAAEISIRYEFYGALLRLGVVPRPYEVDPLRRREQSRGFSPEPKR
ncbi:MAG TPA: hypothetical protein VF251_12855 [Pyrinomonadaceae bacterium]